MIVYIDGGLYAQHLMLLVLVLLVLVLLGLRNILKNQALQT